MTAPDNVAAVNVAWTGNVPDWVMVLAKACDLTSQRAVADRIKRSGALVNQVLKNTYPGDLTSVEKRVKATLMADTVICPGIGSEIALEICLEHQDHARARNRASAFRAQMSLACRQCSHSRIGKNHA